MTKLKKWPLRLLIVLSIFTVLFFFTSDRSRITAKIYGHNTLKAFAQAGSRQLIPGFESFKTGHFNIKFKATDRENVARVGEVLERSYEAVGRAYGYYPDKPVLVFLYASQREMWNYQWAVRGQAVLGLYDMGIIHVLSPGAYLEENEEQMQDYEKNGPILHEYAHLVIDELSGGNVENWLTEGLALYEEYAVNGVEWAPGFQYDHRYKSRELRQSFGELNEYQAYRQSFEMVRMLAEDHGREKIIKLLGELKKGNGTDKAFEAVYGFTADAFVNGFAGEG